MLKPDLEQPLYVYELYIFFNDFDLYMFYRHCSIDEDYVDLKLVLVMGVDELLM